MYGNREFDNKNHLDTNLAKKLGPEFLSDRVGPGGKKIPYIEGWRAVELANDILGFNGWSNSIVNQTVDVCDTTPDGKFNVAIATTVRVTLKDGSYREDIGYGYSENIRSRCDAFEKARKSSVTDGIKRALKHFGNVLGNCMSSKDYLKKVKGIPLPNPRPLNGLYRHKEFLVKHDPNSAKVQVKPEPPAKVQVEPEPPAKDQVNPEPPAVLKSPTTCKPNNPFPNPNIPNIPNIPPVQTVLSKQSHDCNPNDSFYQDQFPIVDLNLGDYSDMDTANFKDIIAISAETLPVPNPYSSRNQENHTEASSHNRNERPEIHTPKLINIHPPNSNKQNLQNGYIPQNKQNGPDQQNQQNHPNIQYQQNLKNHQNYPNHQRKQTQYKERVCIVNSADTNQKWSNIEMKSKLAQHQAKPNLSKSTFSDASCSALNSPSNFLSKDELAVSIQRVQLQVSGGIHTSVNPNPVLDPNLCVTRITERDSNKYQRTVPIPTYKDFVTHPSRPKSSR